MRRMKKNCLPFAYILAMAVIIATLALTIWQFTLAETNPLMVMVTLCGGGGITALIIALYRMKRSYMPFSAGAVPIGVMLIWSAFVFLACGIWYGTQDASGGIIMVTTALLLAFLGYKAIK